jgi:putative transposase
MSGDAHVRICESLGVKFPRATRLVLTINRQKHWLWRAVDQDGFVLDALVQSRRDRRADERLLRKLMRKQARTPRVLITDKLKSYGAARAGMGLKFEHRQYRSLRSEAMTVWKDVAGTSIAAF